MDITYPIAALLTTVVYGRPIKAHNLAYGWVTSQN